jgi:hypothetical protein
MVPASIPVRRFRSHAGRVASGVCLALFFSPVETVGGDQNAGAQVSPNGGELQVNSYTTSDQRFPAVASDASGNFVVAWHSIGSSGTDTSGFSVQAQRYDGFFRDGFETGDTDRWSSAVP